MKETFYYLYWNDKVGYYLGNNFNSALLKAKSILSDKQNHPNTIVVEIRPADSEFSQKFHIRNNQSYYLHKLKNNKHNYLEFFNGLAYTECDKFLEMTYDLNKKYLEPAQSEETDNLIEPMEDLKREKQIIQENIITLLLEPAEIIDLIILLNFIKPANKEVEKYFKQELIDKLKSQLGLAIRP